ncbi:MAG: hypothetical protein J7M25_03235 [Deltaproteobacteria bacterium]|nr:hypothetical protein [Deltaproteobacteria bacterium]
MFHKREMLGAIVVAGLLVACSDDDTTKAARCGDGVVNPELGEQCDGHFLGGHRCEDLGFLGGTLGCIPPGQSNECHYDTSMCTGPECGNGVREVDEQCDGYDLAGQSCQLMGHDGGELKCFGADADAPCTFDQSDCKDKPYCGDGEVETGEDCDGSDLNEQTCQTLGYVGGQLICSNTCTFDKNLCTQPVCGNDTKEATELCDGTDLGDQTCVTQGFIEGTLACKDDCSGFDTQSCSGTPVCDNGIIEGWEVCDGTDLAGQTCLSQGFLEGDLACSTDCKTFDTSGCSGTNNCQSDGDLGTLTPNNPSQYTGDLSTAADTSTLSCNMFAINAKDQVIQFSLSAPGDVDVDYDFGSAMFPMFAIGLFDAGGQNCDSSEAQCDTTMQATGTLSYVGLAAGLYYIIVEEGMAGSGGPYTVTATLKVTEDCSNGVDDDQDGLTDCADSLDCCTDTACANDSQCDGFDDDPCTQDASCLGNKCLDEAAYGFPGGICSRDCVDGSDCASGYDCFTYSPTNENVCLKLCSSGQSSECRSGYTCSDLGTSGMICLADCAGAGDCPDTSVCNPYSGLCGAPVGTLAVDGQPCTAGTQCESGICLDQTNYSAPGGYCTSLCSLTNPFCPGDGVCIDYSGTAADNGSCFDGCSQQGDCRSGYTCRANPHNPPPTNQICDWP